MKKYFLSIVALAGMLFATSCQESLVEPQVEGLTTFTVQLPDQMGTKAIGDAENVNKLFVQVYSADGKTLIYSTSQEIEVSTTVSLSLIQDQQYDVIFWAQNGTAYETIDLRSIPMDVNHHNSESGAAFFASINDYTPVAEAQSIKLRRPFAQLNLGTSLASLSTNAGDVVISRSSISVGNVATHFNAFEGKGYGEQTLNYDFALIPSEKLVVATQEYKYISMDYLPIASDEQALVTVEVVIETTLGNVSQTFTNVPVKENYRTNIVGNLVSTSAEFTVSVDEAWEGVENYPDSNLENLYVAAANGGEVVLTDNVELPSTLVVADDKSMVIDLNGHDIIIDNDSEEVGVGDAIVVYGNLTIKGEGKVQGNTRAVWARGDYGAKVRIEGGHYIGSVIPACEVIYASGNGKIDIYGGTFEAENADTESFAEDQFAVLNLHNNGANGCDIKVYGGSFYKFNPADNVSENPRHNFCAEGYSVSEDGDWFIVAASPYDAIVRNPAELIDALNDASINSIGLYAGTYDLGENIFYLNSSEKQIESIIPTEKAIITGKLVANQDITVKYVDFKPTAATQKDLNTKTYGSKVNGTYAAIITLNHAQGTFENCTFSELENVNAINYFQETSNKILSVDNCRFIGKKCIYSKVLCSVTNSTFEVEATSCPLYVWPRMSENGVATFVNNKVVSSALCQIGFLTQSGIYQNIEFNIQGNSGTYTYTYAWANAVRFATDGSITYAPGSVVFGINSDGTLY